MMQKRKTLSAKSLMVFIFCLLFSGCVIYPEDEGFEGFPQKVKVALLSNGLPAFKAPSEIAGLNLDPDYSDYTSSAKTFLLSYTGANQKDFDDYTNYLLGILGNYIDVSEGNYSCYGWFKGNTGIELGFSDEWMLAPEGNVSIIPPYTLYLLIIIY